VGGGWAEDKISYDSLLIPCHFYAKLKATQHIAMDSCIMSENIMPKIDRHWLVYRESIEFEMRPGAMGKTITEYFESIGFKQTQISPTMIFERGSSLASLYDPNPKHQKTEVSIDIVGSHGLSIVELTMRINSLGNKALRSDYEFWRAEIDGLSHALNYGYVDPRWSDYAAERAKWNNIAVTMGVSMIVMFLIFAVILALVLFI